jgi:dTDP-4-amino-4,6-dideoxygalactose transaminase
MNAHRRRIAGVYNKSLTNPCTSESSLNARPVYTRYPFSTAPGPVSPELERLGIRRMYPHAIPDVDGIEPFLADKQPDIPGARSIAENLITLPTHKGISEDLAIIIASKVKALYHPA